VSIPCVYLVNSHRWLYERFTGPAAQHGEFAVVQDKSDGDLIIYLDPPWPDPEAPENLRSLSLSDLRRIYIFSQNDYPIAWAPGVFASLPRSGIRLGAFAGGFFIAHQHHEPGGLGEYLRGTSLADCDLLWSFVGTAENAPVRAQVMALRDERGLTEDTKRWSDTTRWRWQTDRKVEGAESFRSYAAALQRSKFVLCPRGRGPSSIRLFEALQVGRCPVILSDDWLPPAFVAWDTCSIQIPEAEVNQLPAILREREEDAEQLGTAARKVWERYYAPERCLNTLVRSCIAIDGRLRGRNRFAIAAGGLTRPYVLRRPARWLLRRRWAGHLA
jgi:hypothetical protein